MKKRGNNTQMDESDLKLESRLETISKLVEFATYSNTGISKETEETKSVISTEDSPIQYSKSNNRNEESRRLLTIQALKSLKKPYRLFHAVDELPPHQIEEYMEKICKETKFTGIFKIVKIESDQCLVAEIIGLDRKKYYILFEKELLKYIPSDFFVKGNLYFFVDLIVNYVRAERVVVFLIDQATRSKLFLKFIFS